MTADVNDLVARATDEVRDEYGSVLCAWIDGGARRACAINTPPYQCRCKAVATAALRPAEASLLASQERVEALVDENVALLMREAALEAQLPSSGTERADALWGAVSNLCAGLALMDRKGAELPVEIRARCDALRKVASANP